MHLFIHLVLPMRQQGWLFDLLGASETYAWRNKVLWKNKIKMQSNLWWTEQSWNVLRNLNKQIILSQDNETINYVCFVQLSLFSVIPGYGVVPRSLKYLLYKYTNVSPIPVLIQMLARKLMPSCDFPLHPPLRHLLRGSAAVSFVILFGDTLSHTPELSTWKHLHRLLGPCFSIPPSRPPPEVIPRCASVSVFRWWNGPSE